MSKPLMLITAPIGTCSGYGHHARDLTKILIEMDKFEIKIMDLRWGDTPRNALKNDNPDHQPIIERILKNNQLNKQPDIHIHITVPNEFQPIAKYNIGITAGIESTLCSNEWLQGMNRMHMNIVPSKHVKDVFLKSHWTERDRQKRPIRELKNEKPLEVLFEGADTNVYHKVNTKDDFTELLINEMKNVKSSFNFLFVGHWLKGDIGQDRKDVGMLIKVFLETFKEQKNHQPGLILKISGAGFSVIDREEIMMKIKSIKNAIKSKNLPSIYLLHGELSDKEMNDLYNHPKVKVHITFTKGEGFGRPLLEASLSEKPIITSAYSGQLDFLPKGLAVHLHGQLTNVHKSAAWDKVLLTEAQWFTVNYNYASAVMKDVVKNYRKYELNAKKLGAINKTKFTRNKMKEQFEQILDKYLPEFPTEQPIKLPNLPKLMKKSNTIQLPKLKGVDSFNPKITLPKLQQLGDIKEPVAGSSVESNIIKLPKLNLPAK